MRGRKQAGKPVSRSPGDSGRQLSKIQEAQLEVHLPNQAQHGWEALWGESGMTPKGCFSDFLSNVLIISVPLFQWYQHHQYCISAEPEWIKGLNSSQALVVLPHKWQ